MQVFVDQDDRTVLRQPLEEEPPGGEEILAIGGRPLGESQQVRQPRLQPRAFARVGDVLLDRSTQFLERRLRRFLLEDAGAHAHHLGQRPIGDAFPVRQTAAAVPPVVLGEPVHVFLELPRKPGLADAGDADERRQLCLSFLARRVEQLFDQPELPVSTDERWLEGRGLLGSAARRGHPQRAVERDRL